MAQQFAVGIGGELIHRFFMGFADDIDCRIGHHGKRRIGGIEFFRLLARHSPTIASAKGTFGTVSHKPFGVLSTTPLRQITNPAAGSSMTEKTAG